MNEMRKAFEEITCSHFTIGHSLKRLPNGEYVDDNLEDHRQSFQEGWEAADEYRRQHED